MKSRDRLRQFTFVGIRKGKKKDYTFWAENLRDAADMALAWGRRHQTKMYRRTTS